MKFFKRLFCLHFWVEGKPLFSEAHPFDYWFILGKGQLIPHTCIKCGKVKRFYSTNPPINFIEK